MTSISFRTKIRRMGDKILFTIPKAYHKDIRNRKLVDEYNKTRSEENQRRMEQYYKQQEEIRKNGNSQG
jgi:hypothetical protein